jgi:uncharacterized protein with HEPN domain
MSRHDARVFLTDMLEYATEAAALAASRSRSDLDGDRMFELALTRLLEIVGEAARQMPQSGRERYPQIPWHAVASFRNRIAHAYRDVDLDRVWQIVQDDLPALIPMPEAILGALPDAAPP